jgi:hypothetical protein
MSISTIQAAGASCCRDLAVPVGLLRKTERERTSQPRMDQPSREAMAGKLRIYADKRQEPRMDAKEKKDSPRSTE